FPELVCQIVPSPFTFPWDKHIQDLVSGGYLGNQILAMEVRSLGGAFVDKDAPLSWRQNTAYSGHNIMAMGIFYEALARWAGHASAVMARGKVAVSMRKDPEKGYAVPVEIPEHLDILADMACGAQMNMQISQISAMQSAMDFTLTGDECVLKLDLAQKKLLGARRGDNALQEIVVPEASRGAWRVEEEFIGAIRGEETIKLTSFAEGLRYMEFTDAVH